MSAICPFTGSYSDPVPLDADAVDFAQVRVSVSDRGTIRLDQHGQHVLLTPHELRTLANLTAAGADTMRRALAAGHLEAVGA